MLKIGVTGNIACGKSTVDAMISELTGATIIDADRVTHHLLRDDVQVREAVIEAFGPGILHADGRIDRAMLGRVAFSSAQELLRLEQIVHPAVRSAIRKTLSELGEDGAVVVDAVKLLGGDLGGSVDYVWWVTADPKQQLERLMRARGLPEEEARSRIAVQPSLDLYRSQVHAIIDNSGSLAETRNQVVAALSVGFIRARLPGLPGSADS